MANNPLDIFKGKPAAPSGTRISVTSVGPIARPVASQPVQRAPARAAAIYGGAAAVFAVMTIFMLIKGQWFTGLVMIVPTFCLAGFAYHYMK